MTETGLRNRVPSTSTMIPSHTTVDTDRYTPVKRSVTDLTISTPGSKARPEVDAAPSRWVTTEFKVYYAVFAIVVPLMVWIPIRLSLESHMNYHLYVSRLSPGWMFGRAVDDSDPQYHTFRSNLFKLVGLALVYLGSSQAIFTQISRSSANRATVIVTLASAMLLALHGISAFKILAILALNYRLALVAKPPVLSRLWPAVIIFGNMVLLFLNHRYEGYKLGALHPFFDPLDDLDGLLPRWHIGFNITMLRIVSFALDYHWRQPSSESPSDYRTRVSTSLPEEEYTFVNFVAYCLYPPLYIAGPIITFNDFTWQLRNPVSITRREQLVYAMRFVACLLTMEAVLHFMYVVAIKDTSAWEDDSPAELSMIGFWNLVVVWLKLLIPWRYFRLWALLDGVDPPENMIRCVANNYSTLGFWRSWHRSYNLWVVRYIYIPLGGAKNMIVSTIMVFTFVALWHDLSFKLLAWGWLISLFILPEIIARQVFSHKKYGQERWYRHVSACGGVVNILMMMSANLVGFVLGLDGMRHLVKELVSTWNGLWFLAFASGCLFVAVQVMFEYREEERRRGIDRRC